jgi:Terminase small subunit
LISLAHFALCYLRHERFAQALAQGKTATEAYALAGYKANDGNASRLKGNERISARAQEIVGRAAERAEVSLERVLRDLAAIAFSRISNAVTWGPSVQVREEEEDGRRVKVSTPMRRMRSGCCARAASGHAAAAPPRSAMKLRRLMRQ